MVASMSASSSVRGGSRPWLIAQAVQAVLYKAPTSFADRHPDHTERRRTSLFWRPFAQAKTIRALNARAWAVLRRPANAFSSARSSANKVVVPCACNRGSRCGRGPSLGRPGWYGRELGFGSFHGRRGPAPCPADSAARVLHLGGEVFVARDFESVDQMRRQPMRIPDPLHTALIDASSRLPPGTDELPCTRALSSARHEALKSRPYAAQPTRDSDLGADAKPARLLSPEAAHPSSLARMPL